MLARLQQIITLGLLTLSAAWAWHFIANDRLIVAAAGAVVILLGYAAFLAFEFVLLAVVGDPAGTPPPNPLELTRAWWGEVVTAPRVFCWQQPFRSRAIPDLLQASPGSRGVLFLHGFVCNRGFWNTWMKRLRRRSTPYVAVNLEPLFGSIELYVPTIDSAISRLQAATGMAPIVVAHSMGGLAVREWLRSQPNDSRVAHVITIGSPHGGTWLARWGRTRNGTQMRLANPWLAQLSNRRGPAAHARFTCFYSNCDNIVFPASTATLDGANNRLIAGRAHVQMAFDPIIYAHLLHLLDAAAPSESQSQR